LKNLVEIDIPVLLLSILTIMRFTTNTCRYPSVKRWVKWVTWLR